MIGAVQDITQRKEVETALAARERFLEIITENMFDMVALVDLEGHFEYASPSHRQLGYEPSSLVGRFVLELVHEQDKEMVEAEIIRVFEARESRKVRYRYRCRDGGFVWLESIGQVISNQGQSSTMIVSSRDVSELKRIQEDLQVEKETAQRYLDVAAVMLLGIDLDGRISLINRRGCEILGITDQAAIIGRKFASHIPSEDLPASAEVHRRLLRGDVPGCERFESWVLTSHGKKRRIAWCNAVIRDEQNRIIGTLSSGEDVTDRRIMELQLAKAERLSTMGLLAAGVAHELNNPLSYVLSNLESLAEDLPGLVGTMRGFFARVNAVERPGEFEELARETVLQLNSPLLSDLVDRANDALTGTRRMREITRGLGTFARVDDDQLIPVNIKHVIELAINLTHNEMKYRARIVKDYGRLPLVLAHEGRLCQVFVNLLTNAAHAIEEGNVENNEIRVTTWTDGDDVCVEVRDTGSGISPDDLGKLFEPFFTTKKIGHGSGLGLPISKNIIETYGGTLSVTSEVGKGSRFTVKLPPGAIDHVPIKAPEEPTTLPKVSGRILIVDDEEGTRTAISRVLRGHTVVQAASGAQAMEILERDCAFDLVLCDVMMSDVSGTDLHKWLLVRHPRLGQQLIFMTGGAFTPRARDYLSRIDNLRLEKPVDSANLRRIVSDRIQLARQVQ